MTTIYFEGKWNPSIEAYKPPVESKVQKIIYNVISVVVPIIGLARLCNWGLKKLCNRLILQGNSISKEHQKDIEHRFQKFWFSDSLRSKNSLERTYFDASKLQLKTPDDINLAGHLFKHKQSDENTPTLILFQGNAALSESDIYRWMLESSVFHEKPCNFVIFDYRSVGKSEGTFEGAKDLILDAETVYQFVADHLKISEEKIHFLGYSLGGGVSAQLSALHPNLHRKHIFERTFTDLPSVVQAHAGKNLIGSLACWILKFNEFNLDTLSIFDDLKGKKLITFHPEDPVIPPCASLGANVESRAEVLEMQIAKGYISNNAHCDPVIRHEDQNGTWLDQKIMNFLSDESVEEKSRKGAFIQKSD